MKLEKTEMSVPAHPSLPSRLNGIRRWNNSSETDKTLVRSHNMSVLVFDNKLRRKPVPKKFNNDLISILTYLSTLSKKRK
jgi:hypothetical protein